MSNNKTVFITLNDHGKFDAMNEDGEITFPNIANGFVVVELISGLESNMGSSRVRIKTFENNTERFFEIPIETITSETRLDEALVRNDYFINSNFMRYVMAYLKRELQRVQVEGKIRFQHKSLGLYRDSDKSLRFLLEYTETARGPSTYKERHKLKFKKGLKKDYMAFVQDELMEHVPTQMALVMGLSSVTASYLKDEADTQTLVINLCGPSSSGKTTMAQLMASFWGDPRISNEGVVKTFNNTKIGRFHTIEGYNGFPIIFDDLTAGSTGIRRSDLVYQLSQGEARLRSSNYGRDVSQGNGWSGTAIITSETPLLHDAETRQGLLARVIDTNDITWTQDSDHALRIKQTIQSCYGHLGPEFVERFMQLSFEEIKRVYDDAHESMDSAVRERDNLTDRLINKLAIIQTTALLADNLLPFDIKTDEIQKKLIEFEQKGIENRHIGIKALEHVKLYVQRHNNRFNIYRDHHFHASANGELLGKLDFTENTVIVSIPTQIIKEILAENKIFEYENVLKYWGEHGIIHKQSGRHTVNTAGLDSRSIQFVFEKTKDTLIQWVPNTPYSGLSHTMPPEDTETYDDPDDLDGFPEDSGYES